ncbi:uncharacterized protein TNCV_2426801 [Trichonephila clavipes]|nr:uncharacterized protein TNCV_2426801 [Trichonephila clavipes]
MEEIGGLGIPLHSLWPTLHYRWVAGVSPLLSISWWYLSSVSPKRHCCRVSTADKGWRLYPLDPHPDAVVLYSGCTPDSAVPDDWYTASLVELRGERRCASVGHSSTDCTLEPKCVNCTQSHPSDSKICSKWRIEKQIQEIKTNKNISYPEALKLIVPQLSQTYAQAAKSSTLNNSSQTDENITKIKCPPFNLLKPLSFIPKPNTLISTPAVSTSSSSTQAQLLPSTSSIAATVSKPEPPTPIPNDVLSNNRFTPIVLKIHFPIQFQCSAPFCSYKITEFKRKGRSEKKQKVFIKKLIDIKMAQHRPKKSSSVEYTTDEENMIVYYVEEDVNVLLNQPEIENNFFYNTYRTLWGVLTLIYIFFF